MPRARSPHLPFAVMHHVLAVGLVVVSDSVMVVRRAVANNIGMVVTASARESVPPSVEVPFGGGSACGGGSGGGS